MPLDTRTHCISTPKAPRSPAEKKATQLCVFPKVFCKGATVQEALTNEHLSGYLGRHEVTLEKEAVC